ncbi:hypothetical protein NE237_029171 [Protea cynaroides]|uniref:Uncharacterized protein n=1 Tax=Protea cynaroides TaxID=273540 RepID=A0A9Q0JTJ7_9MAGN|nr:hypothetical protein NE237_029171 [Protea cynaroides]
MSQHRGAGKHAFGLGMNCLHPPLPQLDERWFRSEAAQAHFLWFEEKNIESGRRVNLEQLQQFDVEAAFGRLGWLPVITYTVTTRPNLVKHFYANLEIEENVNDFNRGRELHLTTFVKGVVISFNTHQFVDLLGIPNDGDLVYYTSKMKGFLTDDLCQEISEQILNPRAPMKAASLRPVPRVCLPYIIIRTMCQATLPDQANNLPYSRLITTLLQRLQVDMRGETTVEDTMTSDIDWDAILRMRMDNPSISDEELEARPRPLRRVAATAAAAAATS